MTVFSNRASCQWAILSRRQGTVVVISRFTPPMLVTAQDCAHGAGTGAVARACIAITLVDASVMYADA